MIRVKLSGQLSEFMDDAREVKVDSAATVAGLLDLLEVKFPGLKGRILDDQEKIRPYVNIFVDGENVRDINQENTRLGGSNLVHILPSVAGG